MSRHPHPPRSLSGALALAMALLLVACAPTPSQDPSPPAGSPAASPVSTGAVPSGPRPIVIDTDMAGDDLLAVMALLREPSVDVRAIAIDGNGEVHCLQGLNNMRHLLEAFGVSDVPIACGREEPGPSGRLFPDEWRAGADAFYGVDFPPLKGTVETVEDAPTLIADAIAAAERPVTLVPLGTWTNLADAFAADPTLIARVAGIHAMAGAIDVPGNVTAGDVTPEHGLEWNVAVDPESFAAVLATEVPVTLVPLDATNDVPVPAGFAAVVEEDHAAAGADIAFEMFARSPSLTDQTSFWDTLAVMALVDPGLVEWEDLTVTVETEGPSAGRLVRSPTGRPIRAAMSADPDTFVPALLAALRRGEPRPEPFDATTLGVIWDGTACGVTGQPTKAGTLVITFVNEADEPAAVMLGAVGAPRTWADVIAFLESVDLSSPDLAPPDWLVPVGEGAYADAGGSATAIVELPAGEVGIVCTAGEWPEIEFVSGGSFPVAE